MEDPLTHCVNEFVFNHLVTEYFAVGYDVCEALGVPAVKVFDSVDIVLRARSGSL